MNNIVIRVNCEIESTKLNPQDAKDMEREAEKLFLLVASLMATEQLTASEIKRRILTPIIPHVKNPHWRLFNDGMIISTTTRGTNT